MRYRLSRKAAADIESIFVFGAREFGLAQAEKYHAGLRQTFAFVVDNPVATRERPEFSPPVRIHVFGAHVVIYVLDEEGVLILRVLGGAQDWRRHL